MEDSLHSGVIPSLTTDPKLSSFGNQENGNTKRLIDTFSKAGYKSSSIQATSAADFTRDYANDYIELQYHGTLGVDAIESIFIPRDKLPDVNMTLLNTFKGKFKVYSEKTNGDLDEIF